MSPLLVVTPVAPAAQASAATLPTVKPLLSRKRSKAPAAVLLTAKLLVTVLATSHRSTLPAATTARFWAVMAPAPPAVCVTAVPELMRTVAVLAAPVLDGRSVVMGHGVVTRSRSTVLVGTPVGQG